jgi:phage terminase large subunit-like protein
LTPRPSDQAPDAPLVHGLTPTLALVDELHAHRDAELYLALRTAMLKRPGAQLVTISTAGTGSESPLGRLRTRALAMPSVERSGTVTRAEGPAFVMLEWAVPEGEDIDDPAVVKRANPASWITKEGLREQREAVQDLAFRRYHANQWTLAEEHWLPPGAWQACAGMRRIESGERVWVGVDVGGERSASAVVWVTEDLRVGSDVFEGDAAVLEVAARVRKLAGEYEVMEVVHDPWRFQQAALELAADGLPVVQFPQSNVRMVPASERLYAAVIERRLTHPNDAVLNRHVATAVARSTPRGWRLDKAKSIHQIDAVVALAMAVERAEQRRAPVELLGWL